MEIRTSISILLLLVLTLLRSSTSQQEQVVQQNGPQPTSTTPEDDLLVQSIAAATSQVRNQEIQYGADLLSDILSSLPDTSSLFSLVQNNLAAALLLGATSNHRQHNITELLQSSTTLSPWCTAPFKNLRWHVATITDDHQTDDLDVQSLSLELHSWRQAVSEFARRGLKAIDHRILRDMTEDKLVRYLKWCISGYNDEKVCSSPLGAPITLSVDENNNVVTSAENNICWHKDLWMNLFDDEAVPAHRHICHPPKLNGQKQQVFTGSK
jgi:hypothetical protein